MAHITGLCSKLKDNGVSIIAGLRVLKKQSIVDKYILKRWMKDINRKGMLREFSNLISASELNMNVRECIEEGFKMMKDKIIAEVGPYYMDNSKNEGRSSGIKDPVGSLGIYNSSDAEPSRNLETFV
ncbi:hypothetical protein M9H77_02377 [Catharanthus roseus]|uniref:Uncharacterized protein n=1 Tax=Catharanthus roseus TaxID=4058 RepID=A0ACC0C8C4_CATRO|nr:hypothetical protein M9H77_02377 [Catharanthus roseus]